MCIFATNSQFSTLHKLFPNCNLKNYVEVSFFFILSSSIISYLFLTSEINFFSRVIWIKFAIKFVSLLINQVEYGREFSFITFLFCLTETCYNSSFLKLSSILCMFFSKDPCLKANYINKSADNFIFGFDVFLIIKIVNLTESFFSSFHQQQKTIWKTNCCVILVDDILWCK